MFWKVVLLEISRNSILTRVASLKVYKDFLEQLCNELLFSKFQAYKLQPLALRVFKIPENSHDNMCC